MDLGTNYVYYVMKSGIAASIGNNYDSILNKMVDGMTAKTGKVISKKNILLKMPMQLNYCRKVTMACL
jgi:hypothetical protein